MATTYTPVWRLAVLAPLDPATSGSWGAVQDATMPLMEQGAVGNTPISINGLTSYSLTVANNSTDQARLSTYNFTGALTGDCTVTVPNIARWGWGANSTSGGHNVILTTGSGTTVTIAPGGTVRWSCDGSNNLAPTGVLQLGNSGALVTGGSDGGVALTGTNTNDNAAAGQVGELIKANASAVGVTTNTPTNVTSAILSAGDWNVWGLVGFAPSSDADLTVMIAGVGTTSATFLNILDGGTTSLLAQFTSFQQTLPAPMAPISLAAPTTVYLVGQANYIGGSLTSSGVLFARRVR